MPQKAETCGRFTSCLYILLQSALQPLVGFGLLCLYIIVSNCTAVADPAAARSQVLVCGRSLTVIVGSNPAVGMDVCHLCVLCAVS